MSGSIKDFDNSDVEIEIPEEDDMGFLLAPFNDIDPTHEHKPWDTRIFVFGSNLLGIHGAGAAWYAKSRLEAQPGVGEGLTGRTYALPTCYRPGEPVTLSELAVYMDNFFRFAESRPDLRFFLSKVGCGIAGFEEDEVAWIVNELGVPNNVDIPPDWHFTEVD